MSYIDLPIGSIIVWENLAVPSGWALCDGTNGTPDLRNKFVRGASIDGDIRVTGGVDSHYHTNSSVGSRAAHNHGGSKAMNDIGGGSTADSTSGTGTTVSASDHGHDASVAITAADLHSHTLGNTDTVSLLPIYILRSFIRRIS